MTDEFPYWIANIATDLESCWMNKPKEVKIKVEEHIDELLSAHGRGITATCASWALHRCYPLKDLKGTQ